MRSSHLAVAAVAAGVGLLGWSVGGVSRVDGDLRARTSQPVVTTTDAWRVVDVDDRAPGPLQPHRHREPDRRGFGI